MRPAFCASTTRPAIVCPGSATTTPFTTRGCTSVAEKASPAWLWSEERYWFTRTVMNVPAGTVNCKRGYAYLRKLFIQGALAVLPCKDKPSPGLRNWLLPLAARTHYHVALANKLARITWAVLATREAYRPPVLPSASA